MTIPTENTISPEVNNVCMLVFKAIILEYFVTFYYRQAYAWNLKKCYLRNSIKVK